VAPVTETKAERLGLRGTLSLFESTYRLVGAANATGAIAAGAAFHAFEKNGDVQSWVATAAVLFLFGILWFAIAYMLLFTTTIDMDQSLRGRDENERPEHVLLPQNKTKVEELQKSARKYFVGAVVMGSLSFIFFIFGLAWVLLLAVHLKFSKIAAGLIL
jgi:hypothetical protein